LAACQLSLNQFKQEKENSGFIASLRKKLMRISPEVKAEFLLPAVILLPNTEDLHHAMKK